MTPQRALECLEPALISDRTGRLLFACKKARVVIRLRNHPQPLIFRRSDNIAFRIHPEALVIEALKDSHQEQRLLWESVECLTAGEPETDCRDLFQG